MVFTISFVTELVIIAIIDLQLIIISGNCLFFRCAEVVVKLQLCTDQLSQLSDIRPHLEVRTIIYFLCMSTIISLSITHYGYYYS